MHQLFGELKKLPCSYCRYYYNTSSKCLKRVNQIGELEPCDAMSPNFEVLVPAIQGYFEYLDSIIEKNEKST